VEGDAAVLSIALKRKWWSRISTLEAQASQILGDEGTDSIWCLGLRDSASVTAA
jgi:hypothetical protein